MTTQRLVILGVLNEGPKHGYEIRKYFQKQLGVFTSLENKSIYYPLRMMEKEGLIKKETFKTSRQITCHRFTITSKGQKEFLNRAMEALLSTKRPFIEIDIPLYFLPRLDARQVQARLRVRKLFLVRARTWLKEKLNSQEDKAVHRRLLLTHHLNLLSAEENFVEEMLHAVKRGEGIKEVPKV